MLAIAGYEVLTLLHEGEFSQVYRGKRLTDGLPVVLKTLRNRIPEPEQLARYQQEYAITQALDLIPGVINVYGLEQVAHLPIIVLEDYGGQTLGEFLARTSLAIADFLNLASAIVQTLGAVHSAHVIHKDINPANILIHPVTQQVKLIDFGIASQLSRETPMISGMGLLEGTLAYLSPEQTGRMNRAVDYRTDFYSLGATFFQMLTGHPPFQFQDPLELIHAHIARTPPDVRDLRPEVPAAIAAIVQKLLAKTAEERYQSARGLVADLHRCQSLDTGEGSIFALGSQDVSDRFQIPQRLYGRDAEVEQILAAFERVSPAASAADNGQRELVLVSGYSGIGKSALVREVYKPITGRRGYLIAGKFDPLQRNIPYRALISAFSDLVSQLLTESDEQLAHWRSQLHQALGSNVQVMVALVPQLALIVGEQPSPKTLSGTEAQNRFNLAIQTFIRVFAQPQHPLVVFLDDLQWADTASLNLMQRLLTEPDGHSLLLIGAYRDNEVGPAHPLKLTLDRIQAEGGVCFAIALQPLNQAHITQLVADTLLCSLDQARPLAELIQAKTGGNPFFMAEFLKTLYRDRLITFESAQGRWRWELDAIQQRNVTDNLVELMADSLQQLPPESQRVLQHAACIGTPFDLHSLARVLDQSVELTAEQLWSALAAELVLPVGDTYRLTSVAGISDRPLQYRFAHDRIQQAAYSLLPERDRVTVHHLVGQRLLEIASQDMETSRLFQIVNQLNLGLGASTTAGEALILAGLNLRAGRQAKGAAAYDTALDYLRLGLDLLGPERWDEQPELTADLYQEAAEVACLCGQYDLMTQLITEAQAHVKTLERRTALHLIDLEAIILQNQPRLAVERALTLLRPLGITFPKRMRMLYTIAGLMRTRLRLSRWSDEALRSQPELSDRRLNAAITLLGKVGTSAYVATPDLSPLITFKLLKFSLKQGYTVPTAMSFASYGSVMAGIMGEIDTGYRFGELAVDVADRLQAPMIRCRARFLFNYLIRHWKQPLRTIAPHMEEVYQLGLEAGDLEYSAFALHTSVQLRLMAGDPLSEIVARVTEVAEAIERLQQQTALRWVRTQQAFLEGLMTPSETGPLQAVEIPVPEQHHGSDRTAFFLAYSYRLQLHYLFGNIDQALVAAEQTQEYLDAATSAPTGPPYMLYASLSQLAWWPHASRRQRRRFRRGIQSLRKKFRHWARFAPENYDAAHHLLEAEFHRSQNRFTPALAHFQRAIQAAQTHRRLVEEAIAHERIGELYLQLDQSVAAAAHLSRAHFCYQLWGATAKTTQLRRRYAHLISASEDLASTAARSRTTQQTATSTSTGRLVESLDFSSVMKASEAIASEIVLDQLITRLMEILIESAGAQSGVLLLNNDGELRAEAYGTIASGTTQVIQRDDDTPSQTGAAMEWPAAIVNYVMRTQQSLVLDNAAIDDRFSQDPYIQTHQPQSVLCAPLKNQGRLSGLIYLENNLAPNAFTPNRLEVLSLLSSQAAIALDNARLYTNLADLNAAYARFVPRQFLQHLNKRSIIEVNLGDQVQLEMSVMFSDIRAFTTLSETLTPEDNFRFINDYLACMEPVIIEHGGFIDKYIGDAIMALFSGHVDEAVTGGIAMQRALTAYNAQRQQSGHAPIRIGIGINTGSLMLGTVGGPNRMDSTVISDAVNLAARLENLTKTYGVTLLISHHTYEQMRYPQHYCIRKIGVATVQGKTQAVTVYEVFDGDADLIRQGKLETREIFEQGVEAYDRGHIELAANQFDHCATIVPDDPVVQYYQLQCAAQRYAIAGHETESPLDAVLKPS